MKSLNLLPQEVRDAQEVRFVGHLVRFWIAWLMALIVVGIIAAFLIGGVVRFQKESFSVQVESLFSQELFRDIAQREEIVKGANEELLKGQAVLEERFRTHRLLADIGTLLPPNVVLETMIYDGEENQIRLSGSAPLRADVLAIEEALLEYDLIEEVESPVSNILESSDIDFMFTAILSQ